MPHLKLGLLIPGERALLRQQTCSLLPDWNPVPCAQAAEQAGAAPSLPDHAVLAAVQPPHHSHAVVAHTARAVFDGRIPSPAELVEWARGQELLAEALGEHPGDTAGQIAPPLRAGHVQAQVGFTALDPKPLHHSPFYLSSHPH